MDKKPVTTLYLLISLDGKISTGVSDKRCYGKDLKDIPGIQEGLQQYYDLEKKTDLHSLNSGKVMAKIGINTNSSLFKGLNMVSFVIIDNNFLKTSGVKNLTKNLKQLYIVTSNKNHPAFGLKNTNNLEIIFYEKEIDFPNLFQNLKVNFSIDKLTVQSGGTLNSVFLRKNLIDKISIVIAPMLVGGKNTSTLVDGDDIISVDQLKNIKALKLIEVNKLKNSYLHLRYDVLNNNLNQ